MKQAKPNPRERGRRPGPYAVPRRRGRGGGGAGRDAAGGGTAPARGVGGDVEVEGSPPRSLPPGKEPRSDPLRRPDPAGSRRVRSADGAGGGAGWVSEPGDFLSSVCPSFLPPFPPSEVAGAFRQRERRSCPDGAHRDPAPAGPAPRCVWGGRRLPDDASPAPPAAPPRPPPAPLPLPSLFVLVTNLL